MRTRGRIRAEQPARRLEVDYFGHRTTFLLTAHGGGGTDPELVVEVAEAELADTAPGWVAVLPGLKAYVDHGRERPGDRYAVGAAAQVGRNQGQVRRPGTQPVHNGR
jgi:hypothetical protein